MITGSIKTYQSTRKQSSYHQWDEQNTHYCHNMPHWSEQTSNLDKMLEAAKLAGFVLEARVQRKHPPNSQNIGTIIAIHETFSLAWNYTTGVLEPIKVRWDKTDSCVPKTFDYDPDELILVNEDPLKRTPQNEDYTNFHFAC